MNIVICGAGSVGTNLAQFLSNRNHHVTIIDASPDLVRKVEALYEVRGIVGHASHPSTLRKAGADDADLFIAVTRDDEVNILACQAAKVLFDVTHTIARVRARSYHDKTWSELFSRTNLSVGTIISPEVEIARSIWRCVQVPGVSEVANFADGRLSLIGLRCSADCPIINTPLRQLGALFPELSITLVRIRRNERWLTPRGNEMMQEGDLVRFIVDTGQIDRALEAFGKRVSVASRVVVLGAGQIGTSLVEFLDDSEKIRTIAIEQNEERAQRLAERLNNGRMLCGDGMDRALLEEAGIENADIFIAATGNDQNNFMACLLAQHLGAREVIATVGQSGFQEIMLSFGIGAAVNSETVSVSRILPHIWRGRVYQAFALSQNGGEVIEVDAMPSSALVSAPLRELRIPPETIFAAAGNEGSIRLLRPDDQIEPGERVVVYVSPGSEAGIEELLRVQLEYL